MATLLTGAVALVVGYFVVFTIAWGVTNSRVLIWLAAAAIGAVIGITGHLLTQKSANG